MVIANTTAVCAAALEHYGEENQILKSIEELSELTRAIAKWEAAHRAHKPWAACVENVHEEIADVLIVVEQLVMIFGEEAVAIQLDRKLNRLRERIEDEKKEAENAG